MCLLSFDFRLLFPLQRPAQITMTIVVSDRIEPIKVMGGLPRQTRA